MKKIHYIVAIGLAVVTMLAVSPNTAEAATLDLNGDIIDIAASAGQVEMINGTTFISEDFLTDKLYLSVEKTGDNFSLTNAQSDFTISGAMGEQTLTFEGQTVPLSVAADEQNGVLYLPLRPVLELFGTVDWDGNNQLVTVRYDYNDEMDLPEVKISEDSIEYEIPMNSGIQLEGYDRAVRMTDDGLLYEKRDEKGNLTAVKISNQTIIEPVHSSYVLRGPAYAVEDDYLYWIEYPDPAKEMVGNQEWYLYIQERKEGAEPVCIDHDSFSELKKITPYPEFYLDNCDFKNGNIIWLSTDFEKGIAKISLYQHEKNETMLLDHYPVDKIPLKGVGVTIGEKDAFWSNINYTDSVMNKYSTTSRVHLDSGKIELFSQGYNFIIPTIVGNNLVVRTLPDGNNFQFDESDASYVSGELWVYDLKKNQWKFKVTSKLPTFSEDAVMEDIRALNDTQIVPVVDVYLADSAMLVVDLETATVQKVVDQEGHSMFIKDMLNAIESVGSDGSMLTTYSITQSDGSAESVVYPVFFKS